MEEIAEHARNLALADAATIVSVSSTPSQLTVAAAVGARASEVRGQPMPADESISGAVMRTGKPLVLDDVSADPRAYQPIVKLGGHGPALFVPLRVRGGAMGTLMVTNLKGGRRFDDLPPNLGVKRGQLDPRPGEPQVWVRTLFGWVRVRSWARSSGEWHVLPVKVRPL